MESTLEYNILAIRTSSNISLENSTAFGLYNLILATIIWRLFTTFRVIKIKFFFVTSYLHFLGHPDYFKFIQRLFTVKNFLLNENIHIFRRKGKDISKQSIVLQSSLFRSDILNWISWFFFPTLIRNCQNCLISFPTATSPTYPNLTYPTRPTHT